MQEGAIDPQQSFGLFAPLTGVQRERLFACTSQIHADWHQVVADIDDHVKHEDDYPLKGDIPSSSRSVKVNSHRRHRNQRR